ncbi:MAG: proline dehydrogenase family protein [Gemmatimonadales bacterium]|nr:proline dehydrogenase family protein [Gemmatimonadales bacterium]
MGLMRTALLKGSESRWLADKIRDRAFAKRAVRRFMPGETIEAALSACVSLHERGMSTVITQVGEAITDGGSAERVTAHYVAAFDRIRESGLPTELSVKPTQLGLDVSREVCAAQLETLLDAASRTGSFVWIDMESSPYVDVTLQLYQGLRLRHHNVGICLQSYLYRTSDDLASLIPLGAAIRLVKGAYMEAPDTAYPRKSDVDENFVRLGKRLLGEEARACGVRVGFGTHDPGVITRIRDFAEGAGIRKDAYEVQMLYGIRRDEQARLAAAGHRLRVLISYGSEWFPWYMRRLAERPANLGFVLRNLLAR